jgi:hypothetical protein
MGDRDDLERTLADLGRVVRGTARMVLGSRVGGADTDEPVISREVDAALEGAVAVVGDWLQSVGEDLQRQGGEDPEPVETTGWSPLAVGAQAFGRGLRSVAAEFAHSLKEEEE